MMDTWLGALQQIGQALKKHQNSMKFRSKPSQSVQFRRFFQNFVKKFGLGSPPEMQLSPSIPIQKH